MRNRSILVTKFAGNKVRSDMVARPRLGPCFDRKPFSGLSLVCAQAGYGKTTLVSSWVHARTEQVAWLSLDRQDNDSVRFLAHLVASIRNQMPDFEPELARILQSPNPPPIALLMTGLVNALAGLGRRLILVLDDYHVITEKTVHDALLFLLDHQPDNLHVIIAAREEPPFSVARLHSHGRLAKFTEADLCFTPQEAEEFFNRVMKLELSPHESDTLRGHTEGWAAGLQLAALSLANVQSKEQFIAGFSGKERHIIDFLVDEVLSNQAEPIQSFLMRTSILERFNASLCRTLTGEADSQAMLDHLERSHMFLVPLDANREWYRYHHLFADLLQSRLARTRPEQVAGLHSAAGRWYCEHQFPADALRHAHNAQDTKLIAQILDRHALNMFVLGEVRTVASWLRLLPEKVILQYPRVALLAAFNIYFRSIPDAALAERYLAGIDRVLAAGEGSDPYGRDMAGKVAVVRGYQARYGGQADVALRFFSMASECLQKDDVFYDIAIINLGILHAALGRLDEAAEIFHAYSEVSDDQPNLWMTMTGIYGLSRIQLIRGNLRLAHAICIDGLRQFRDKGLQDLPVCSMLHLQLAEIAYLQNRLDDADMQASRALELARAGGMELNHGCSEVLLVQVKMARGEQAGLEPDYERRLLGFWASASLILPLLSGYLAQLWLMQGRIQEVAAHLAQRGIDSSIDKPERELEYLVLAKLLLQQQRTDEAFELLSRLLLNAERGQRRGALVNILILQALVRQAEDKLKSATSFLCHALALAQENGHIRPFLDAGLALRLLLQKADVPASVSVFAERILAAFDAGSGCFQGCENVIAAFSIKEEKVARLLVAGLSNEEIAARLFVSPNTVKFHLKNLYRKLGVTKRFDAIQKIRS